MLGVYVTLDQNILYNNNYSSDSSLKLTGTVYSDVGKTSAFNITGYTLTLGLYKDGSLADYFNQACTITVAASGTFYLSITNNTLPISGIYLARLQLSKSGTQVSNLNRMELLIKKGP